MGRSRETSPASGQNERGQSGYHSERAIFQSRSGEEEETERGVGGEDLCGGDWESRGEAVEEGDEG